MKYLVTALSAFLLVSVISLISLYSHYTKELFLERHTVIECNSRYMTFHGNKTEAQQWAMKSCPMNFDIAPNQDYDDTV